MLINFLERHFYKTKKERSFWQSITIDIAAILMWRGVWGLMDLYIFPGYEGLSFLFSAVLGIGLLVILRPMIK